MSVGDKNAYYCAQCRSYIVTVDMDDGVTPMFLACRAKGEPDEPGNDCKGRMQSMMYPVEPWPSHDGNGTEIPTTPTWEWYRPGHAEMNSYRRHGDEGTLEHVRKGGLLLRKRQAPGVVSACRR